VSGSLRTKIKILLDKLYGQRPTKPQSYFFEAVYEALPELEELDPKKVRQMVAMAFAQNEVDHASHAEETLRHLVDRVRHEANRSPEYVKHVEQEHAQAVQHHAQANQRLDQIMRDSGGRSQ
jgi:uncharacterized protein (DUF3084 family)